MAHKALMRKINSFKRGKLYCSDIITERPVFVENSGGMLIDPENPDSFLSNSHKAVKYWPRISRGGSTSTIVDLASVIKLAQPANSHSIICAHNHPSGNLRISSTDKALTKRLVDAGRLLGIEITDHLILTRYGYSSFNQQGFFISPHAFLYCHTFRNIIPIHLLRTDHSDMLRSILLAAFFSLGLSASMKSAAGCSRSSESPECPDQEITVEGHLRLFGNEPFVRTAIITDDDSRYYLQADSGELDASGLSGGVYLYRLRAELGTASHTASGKMLLVK